MAAIDPTATAIPDLEHPDAPPRATLKMIRHYEPLDFDDDDDEDDDEDDEDIDEEDVAEIERKLGLVADDDSEEEDSEDEAGPSNPQKVLQARAAAAKKRSKLTNGVDEDEDVDMDALPNGVNGIKKGKAKASDDDDEEEDEDEDEDDYDELDDEDDVELPLCTLDTTQHYQQALDLTVMDPSTVSFKVIGTHSIFLTGNFVEVPEDDDSDDEDEMGLGNELDYDAYDNLLAPYDEDSDSEDDEDVDSEEDELDDLEDPRIEELGTDEDEAPPKLIKAKAAPTKGKNKRPAESEDEEVDDLDNLISKTLKSEAAEQVNGEQKLSKKQLKKLKKNDGQAAPAATGDDAKKSAVKDSPANAKKVQFAKELEQGPTPTKADTKADAKKDTKPQSKGVRVVQGVTIDERKEGSGPGAKKGDRIGMRYIGKTEKDNKVFDCKCNFGPLSL